MWYNPDYIKKRFHLGNYSENVLGALMASAITYFINKKDFYINKHGIIAGNKVKLGYMYLPKKGGFWEIPTSISLDDKLAQDFEKEFPSFNYLKKCVKNMKNEMPPDVLIPEDLEMYIQNI